MAKTYQVNEVFYSLQGEGVRAGTPNIFIRFTGCNLRCAMEAGPRSPGGFDCDTEFMSGRSLTLDELAEWVVQAFRERSGETKWMDWEAPWFVLTGGEPGLQVDTEFINYWKARGVKMAIETNGSIELPEGLDWITVSPKVAEHCIKQRVAHEVKYVRGWGQGIPKTAVTATHYLISPAFAGNELDPKTLDWCIKLCLENPPWRLSIQNHKAWKVR